MQFFSKQSLFSIGGLVGSTMKLDVATTNLDRLSVARMCIEMNLLKKFPHKVWIGYVMEVSGREFHMRKSQSTAQTISGKVMRMGRVKLMKLNKGISQI